MFSRKTPIISVPKVALRTYFSSPPPKTEQNSIVNDGTAESPPMTPMTPMTPLMPQRGLFARDFQRRWHLRCHRSGRGNPASEKIINYRFSNRRGPENVTNSSERTSPTEPALAGCGGDVGENENKAALAAASASQTLSRESQAACCR